MTTLKVVFSIIKKLRIDIRVHFLLFDVEVSRWQIQFILERKGHEKYREEGSWFYLPMLAKKGQCLRCGEST